MFAAIRAAETPRSKRVRVKAGSPRALVSQLFVIVVVLLTAFVAVTANERLQPSQTSDSATTTSDMQFENVDFANPLPQSGLRHTPFSCKQLCPCGCGCLGAAKGGPGQRVPSQIRVNFERKAFYSPSFEIAAAAALLLGVQRKKKPQRGCIYARYSSRFQQSIDDQVRRCREWCRQNGVTVPEDKIFIDRAETGQKQNRPGLLKMIASLDAGEVDVVVSFATNRLYRKIYRSLQFVEQKIIDKQRRCVFVAQHIDTADTKMWKALVMVFAVLDEYQLTATVENIQAAHEGLLLQGLVHNTLPFGYVGEEAGDGTTWKGRPAQRIVIKEELIPWVIKAFNWFVNDQVTYRQIAKRLRDESAPPPPRAKRWSRNAVKYMLRNRRYTGDWSYGRRQSTWSDERDSVVQVEREQPLKEHRLEHLRVVEDQLFEAAQSRMARLGHGEHRARLRKDVHGETLIDVLTNVLWCPQHNRPLTLTGATGDAWACPDCKRIENAEDRCLYSQVNCALARDMVIEELIRAVTATPETLAAIRSAIDEHVMDLLTRPTADPQPIRDRIAKIESDIAFIFENIGETAEEKEQTRKLIRGKRDERRRLESQLDEIERIAKIVPELPSPDAIDAVLNDMRQILAMQATGEIAADRRVINQIIKLLVGGRIVMRQIGPKQAKQGHLEGTFVPLVASAVAQRNGLGDLAKVAAAPVVIDFVAADPLLDRGRQIAERLATTPDATLAVIARSVGLSPTQAQVARRRWHESRGEPVPALQARGQLIRNAITPPITRRIQSLAIEMYQAGMPLGAIAEACNTNRDTVRIAIASWCREQGTPYLDGRARRKQLSQARAASVAGAPRVAVSDTGGASTGNSSAA